MQNSIEFVHYFLAEKGDEESQALDKDSDDEDNAEIMRLCKVNKLILEKCTTHCVVMF